MTLLSQALLRRPGLAFCMATGLWFVVAFGVSMNGVLAAMTPQGVGWVVTLELAALVVIGFGIPPIRRWISGLDPRWLAGFHLWRIVPATAYLALAAGEILPARFAAVAGWGDLAVALTAPVAIYLVGTRTLLRRLILMGWQLLGLLELVLVLHSAMRLALAGDLLMLNLLQFPVVLIPLFGVPLTLAVHLFAIGFGNRPR